MNVPRRQTLARVGFVASLTVLGFLYGWGSRGFGWFPDALILRAREQARSLVGPPHWVSPRVYDREGARVVEPDRTGDGLTLVSGMWANSSTAPGLQLLDQEGRTVHAWPIRAEELFLDPPDERTRRDPGDTNIHGVHLYPDGDVILNVQYVGTVRLDACGRPEWRLPVGSHHAVAPAADGSFWIPGGRWRAAGNGPVRIDGLARDDSVYHDQLVRVSPSGEVLEEIDVLDLLIDAGLERHLVKGVRPLVPGSIGDLTHVNDIEPLDPAMADEYPLFEGGDLVVSLRNLDLVLVVDPGARTVRWHASEPFIQQHDPDFMGQGWIGVFDNNRDGTERGTLLGGSRIVAVQPHTDSTKVLFPTSSSQPFYTDYQGKWQLLDNGNLLLTEAQAGRVLEVDSEGRTVWEWIAAPHDDDWIPEITEGTRYPWTEERVVGWPCASRHGPNGTVRAGPGRRTPVHVGAGGQ